MERSFLLLKKMLKMGSAILRNDIRITNNKEENNNLPIL